MIPDRLIKQIREGKAVVWGGAGLSIPSGLPRWSELVDEFITKSRQYGLSADEYDELKVMHQGGSFDDVVDFCRDRMGPFEYGEFMRERFTQSYKPSSLHKLVCDIGFSAVLTTNYDKLLEDAWLQIRGTLPSPVLTNKDAGAVGPRLNNNDFFFLKVHGDIDRPDSIVLSARDYTEHIFGNRAFMDFLERLYSSKTILFVSTPFNEYYIRRMLEQARYVTGGTSVPHFAILRGIGPVQRKVLQDRYNVTAISYDPKTHTSEAAVTDALTEIKQRV
jgi:hypothetical protein